MSSINKIHERKGTVTPVEFDSAQLKEKAQRLHAFMKTLCDGPVEAVGVLGFVLDGYKQVLGVSDIQISENPLQ